MIIEVPSADWTHPISTAWLNQVWRTDFEPLRSDHAKLRRRGHAGRKYDVPAPCVFVGSRDSPKRTDQNGSELQHAVTRSHPVIGISEAPARYLAPDLVRTADLRVTVPTPDADALVEVATMISGTVASESFPPDMVRHIVAADLWLAFRPNEGADDWLRRLRRLAEQRAAAVIVTEGPTLDDLGGMTEAVAQGKAIARDLSDFAAGRIPWSECARGLLLFGPPGVGKTLFARALARSAKVPLLTGSLAGWQSAKDGHLGSLLRAMCDRFDEAKRLSPCVLFIDEIDAFGDRASFRSDYRDYSIQVVSGFLECLDGVAGREGVVVLGACNHPQNLDPAIARSGRLDRSVEVRLPDQDGLARILRYQLGADLSDADLSHAASVALGSTGADVARFVRDARRRAREENRPLVLDDLIEAIGGDANGDHRSPGLRRAIAVHEAGHALLAVIEAPGSLVKVTIRADNSSGGKVVEELLVDGAITSAHVDSQLRRLLAGRAAEELVMGQVSAGAGGGPRSDLAKATLLATRAIAAYGMGDESLVWMGLPSAEDVGPFLSVHPALARNVTAKLDEAYAMTKRIIDRHRAAVDRIADLLLERETVGGAEIAAIVGTGVAGAPGSGRRA